MRLRLGERLGVVVDEVDETFEELDMDGRNLAAEEVEILVQDLHEQEHLRVQGCRSDGTRGWKLGGEEAQPGS